MFTREPALEAAFEALAARAGAGLRTRAAQASEAAAPPRAFLIIRCGLRLRTSRACAVRARPRRRRMVLGVQVHASGHAYKRCAHCCTSGHDETNSAPVVQCGSV